MKDMERTVEDHFACIIFPFQHVLCCRQNWKGAAILYILHIQNIDIYRPHELHIDPRRPITPRWTQSESTLNKEVL